MLDVLKVIADYIGIGFGLLAIGISIWGRHRHSISKLWAELDVMRGRIAAVEAKADNLPTHNDLDQLDQRMGEIKSGLSELVGTVKQMDRGVQMIHQHLLSGGGKA